MAVINLQDLPSRQIDLSQLPSRQTQPISREPTSQQASQKDASFLSRIGSGFAETGERLIQHTGEAFERGEELTAKGIVSRKRGEEVGGIAGQRLKEITSPAQKIAGGAVATLAPLTAVLEESAKGYIDLAELITSTDIGQDVKNKFTEIFNRPDVQNIVNTYKAEGAVPIAPLIEKGARITAETVREIPELEAAATIAGETFKLEALGLGALTPATFAKLSKTAQNQIKAQMERRATKKLNKLSELGKDVDRLTMTPEPIMKEGVKFDVSKPSRQTQELMKTVAESDKKIKTFEDLLEVTKKTKEKTLKEKKKITLGISKEPVTNKSALKLAEETRKMVGTKAGLEKKATFLDMVITDLKTKGATIKDIDKLKTTSDKVNKIFKKSGVAKDNLRAEGLEVLRKKVKEVVELEVPQLKAINARISGLIDAEDWISAAVSKVRRSDDPMGIIRENISKIPWMGRFFAKEGVKEAAKLQKQLPSLMKKVKKADLKPFQTITKEVEKELTPTFIARVKRRAAEFERTLTEKKLTEIKKTQIEQALIADDLIKKGYVLGDDFVIPPKEIKAIKDIMKLLPERAGVPKVIELPDVRGGQSKQFAGITGGQSKKITKQIADEVNKTGGITFNLKKAKSLGGTKNFAVSPFPERSLIKKGKTLTSKDIANYIRKNKDLLKKPDHSLGGWVDKDANQVFLDVSIVVPNKAKAMEIGKKFNQKAIFDLKKFEDIPLGGTGLVP
jgi:hypothetical protein